MIRRPPRANRTDTPVPSATLFRSVFVSDRAGSEDIWLMGSDGSSPRPITHDPYSRFISPSFTPDGQSILVSRSGLQTYGRSIELWIYHRAGGKGVAVIPTESTPGTPRDEDRKSTRLNSSH